MLNNDLKMMSYPWILPLLWSLLKRVRKAWIQRNWLVYSNGQHGTNSQPNWVQVFFGFWNKLIGKEKFGKEE